MTTTTERRAAATSPAIVDLGRLAGAVDRGIGSQGTPKGDAGHHADVADQLRMDLLEHLQGIITSRRAETLADVAAQLVAAFPILDWIEDIEDASPNEHAGYVRALRRVVLSAIPIVAAAANVDLGELTATALADYADRVLPPVMRVAVTPGGREGRP